MAASSVFILEIAYRCTVQDCRVVIEVMTAIIKELR